MTTGGLKKTYLIHNLTCGDFGIPRQKVVENQFTSLKKNKLKYSILKFWNDGEVLSEKLLYRFYSTVKKIW